MDLSNLKPAKGSVKERKRVGRGQGSGYGGTSTRGHKGAGQRSGNSHKIGFEGGQMPLARLVPKYGFKNFNRVSYRPVNVMSLQDFADNGIFEINPEILIQYGFAGRKELIKILGDGELTAKMTVKAHAWSKSAEEAITKVGGTIEKI
ncbi:MAG: 50S ribosomal protein L15 [Candidatus Limimorpha sp.]|jgi:large subunit ribosomal protein L15|nr:50S ribosomal protein L15 [Bacteroidales bacterium]MCI7377535.1 50S ribosomal protein L15 [Bacteroidales bacterium]MDD5978472.1 50S ribosomal protein L15 [Bacteroidales bacterium]MDY6075098.1 50S ribosomal protein L15 [Bacteroidales bacterium]